MFVLLSDPGFNVPLSPLEVVGNERPCLCPHAILEERNVLHFFLNRA